MSEFLKYLQNGGSMIEFISFIIIVVAVFYYFEKVCKTVKSYLDLYFDNRTKKNNREHTIDLNKESIKNIDDRVSDLESQFTTFMKCLDKDMQVIHRKEIRNLYEKAKANNDTLSDKDMRDYHYCLECYLAHNGNSYVQDEIVPYMKNVKTTI